MKKMSAEELAAHYVAATDARDKQTQNNKRTIGEVKGKLEDLLCLACPMSNLLGANVANQTW